MGTNSSQFDSLYNDALHNSGFSVSSHYHRRYRDDNEKTEEKLLERPTEIQTIPDFREHIRNGLPISESDNSSRFLTMDDDFENLLRNGRHELLRRPIIIEQPRRFLHRYPEIVLPYDNNSEIADQMMSELSRFLVFAGDSKDVKSTGFNESSNRARGASSTDSKDSKDSKDSREPLDDNSSGYLLDILEDKNNKLIGELKCGVCQDIAHEPVCTQCSSASHLFCKKCLLPWLLEHDSCPTCRSRISQDDSKYQVMTAFNNIINELACHCRFEECKWKGTLGTLDTHLHNNCAFNLVKCKNACNGCDAKLRASEIKEHLATCIYRKEPCSLCHEIIVFHTILEHLRSECSAVEIKCTACGEKVTRSQMGQHLLLSCPERIIYCSFAKYGCKAKFKRSDELKHMRTYITCHKLMKIKLLPEPIIINFDINTLNRLGKQTNPVDVFDTTIEMNLKLLHDGLSNNCQLHINATTAIRNKCVKFDASLLDKKTNTLLVIRFNSFDNSARIMGDDNVLRLNNKLTTSLPFVDDRGKISIKLSNIEIWLP